MAGGCAYNLEQEVHSAYHQAEVPRQSRWLRFSGALRTMGLGIREAIGRRGVTILPYHRHDVPPAGVFLPAYRYPLTVIPTEHGYQGEAFLIQHPFQSLPHPSGLPDETLLSREGFAKVMTSGV